VLKTVIRACICQPKLRLFRHRKIFHGLKVEGLSTEQGGRLVKRQCAIELVWGIVYGAEKMGSMSFCEVVCHVQVLPQVVGCQRAMVRVIDVQLTGRFSTRYFYFPFLVQEKVRKGGSLMVWVYLGLAVIMAPQRKRRGLRRNRNGTLTGT
jgi:hypothetical protein